MKKKDDSFFIKKKESDAKPTDIVKKDTNTATSPVIPEDKLNAVIDLSAESILWLKLVEGGLKINSQDKFIRDVTCRIVDLVPYLMKFEDGVPDKIPHVVHDLDIPPGYERRCDVKILVDDQLFGLSLAPSSVKYYLSPYLKYLKNRGLRPEEVSTRISSRQVANQKGRWSVAVFELVDNGNAPAVKKPPSEPSAGNIPDEWT